MTKIDFDWSIFFVFDRLRMDGDWSVEVNFPAKKYLARNF